MAYTHKLEHPLPQDQQPSNPQQANRKAELLTFKVKLGVPNLAGPKSTCYWPGAARFLIRNKAAVPMPHNGFGHGWLRLSAEGRIMHVAVSAWDYWTPCDHLGNCSLILLLHGFAQLIFFTRISS